MATEAFPLCWPAGWPRTKHRQRANFGKMRTTQVFDQVVQRKGGMSVAEASERLFGELRRLGAAYVTLSTNLMLGKKGAPLANQREPDDPGAAIYFRLGAKDIALACDRWDRVADNIAALAKHIEAMRGMDRWGVGTAAQAFAGYEALPSPEAAVSRSCWQILGLVPNASEMDIERAYREKAKVAHPDAGGSREEWDMLRHAYEQAKRAAA